MPALVALYIRQVLIGFLLSVAFVGLLLGLNVGNLGHLVTTSDVAAVATAMLVICNGIVFAGVQFGIAVMRMQEPEAPADRGGSAPEPVLVPVRVEARR